MPEESAVDCDAHVKQIIEYFFYLFYNIYCLFSGIYMIELNSKNFFSKREIFKMLKFIMVGVLNTIIGNGVMFLFYNLLNFSYWPSTACGYVLGGIVSYFLNKFFTFKNNEKSLQQVLKFVILLIFCYGLSFSLSRFMGVLLLKECSENLRDNISMLFGMCLYTSVNYIGQRFIVFKEKVYDKNEL